jgi:glyoxylase-like metal-dependent hydrolase (beta-lactamase superfamily II)
VLAGVVFVGLGAGDRAQPVRAQINDRPSHVPFAPRPGTAVPQGFEILRVLGNVYLIAGAGGNVVLQTGDEGIFLVDTGSSARSAALLDAVKAVSDGTIRYIVNTTPDADHYGGNGAVAQAGWSPTVALPGLQGSGAAATSRGGDPRDRYAMVIGHERMLNRLSAASGEAPAAPFELWPTNSFFTAKKTMAFNHEGIELRHEPNAHTDGDLVVFFRKSDVIAAGDLIDADGYPKFDAARGGSLAGLIAGLNDVIDMSIAEFNQQGGTRIVPGHGRVMNETDVADYRDMATIVFDRVKTAVEKKMTLPELMALEPTLDYDGLYSRPDWTGAMFVEAIFRELSGARPAVRRP